MDPKIASFMASLTTGIYVLTVADGADHHGMSSSWVTQVSGEPALLMAAVDLKHFSLQAIERRGVFGLNIVGRAGRALEDYFFSPASRRPDNLTTIDYELSPALGVPWLAQAYACVELKLVERMTAGDHRLLVASLGAVRIGWQDRPLNSWDLDYVYVGGGTVLPRPT